MSVNNRKPKPQSYHRFIDEAGDMTFFGKGKIDLLGTEGVSKAFMLGMVHIKHPLAEVRTKVNDFTEKVCQDPFFNEIASIKKRLENGSMYLHANDDPPELRYKFFEVLKNEINFSLQIVVGRKDTHRFINKHNSQEREFYADLLSHLLKDKASYEKLVLNIADRGSATRINNLETALQKAQDRYLKKRPDGKYKAEIKFNVQPYNKEPLLVIADYGLWAVQRVFEKGETRFYEAIKDKIPLVIDLYDADNFQNWGNYYSPTKPLTKRNKL